MTIRPLMTVPEPPTGWANSWPDASEIVDALAPSRWTLARSLGIDLDQPSSTPEIR